MELEKTDQEQVEQLQKWWSENWKSLIGGLVLGLGGILGWEQYRDYRAMQAAEASAQYDALHTAVEAGDVEAGQQTLAQLKSAHASSPYVAHGQLTLAKALAEAGDWDGAAAQLRAVMDGAKQKPLRELARLRLARVHWAQGDTAMALSTLDADVDAAFTPLFAELRGDIQKAAGDIDAARESYQQALASEVSTLDKSAVERKLNDLPS